MERVNALLVGAPRQGKTFFGEKTLIEYAKNGGCSVVYNVGRPTDFARFIEVKIMSASEVKAIWEKQNKKRMPFYEVPSQVEFFEVNGKIYHLSQFSKLFKGKCVKIQRIHNDGSIRNEDYFIAAIYRFFFDTLVMFDDCRTIFRKGLSSEMIGLISRINHAGKAYANAQSIGIDLILTYHGFDTVNNETYQFINRVIQFRTLTMPRLRVDNEELEVQIEQNHIELQQSEKYSHFEIDIFSQKNIFFKP